jgi:hypothetical protein
MLYWGCRGKYGEEMTVPEASSSEPAVVLLSSLYQPTQSTCYAETTQKLHVVLPSSLHQSAQSTCPYQSLVHICQYLCE